MQSFTDNKGRVWAPRVTALTLLRLRQETGKSLFTEAGTDATTTRGAVAAFFQDESVLLTLAYLACEPQAKERRVSQEALLSSLDTQELMFAAVLATQDAVLSFFQLPSRTESPMAEVQTNSGVGKTSID